jgi:hypothetical protein
MAHGSDGEAAMTAAGCVWRRAGLLGAVLGGALLLALAPGRAEAQLTFDGPAYAFPVPDNVSALVNSNLVGMYAGSSGSGSRKGSGAKRPKKPAPKAKPKPKAKPPTKAQLARLRFTRRIAVQNSVFQQAIDASPGWDPALLASELARLTALNHDRLRQAGWDPDNLADTVSASIFLTYLTWKGTIDKPQPKVAVRGVIRQARQQLGAIRAVRRLGDVRKQRISQTLEVSRIFLFDVYADAVASGDPAEVLDARRRVRDWMIDTLGIDPKRIRLTSKGFMDRR